MVSYKGDMMGRCTLDYSSFIGPREEIPDGWEFVTDDPLLDGRDQPRSMAESKIGDSDNDASNKSTD